MLNRRPSPEHQEAVSRRLALLSAELAGVREQPEVVEDPVPFTHTRVAAPYRPAEPEPRSEPLPEPEPPPVPVPGRHAARRFGRGTAGLVPDTLRGRVTLGPAQLALVALLVAAGLAVTCWWVVRGDPRTVAAPTTPEPVAGLASPVASAGADPTASTTASPAGTVTVDVAGKVRRPGIVVLDTGARVVDALKAAGGARPGVDLGSINLARVLVDGEQLLVGVPPVAGVAGAALPTSAPGGALVNLNTATQVELESLPDVGPVTAEAILAWRTEHGGFTAVDELLEVDGIGDATLATIAPHVTV